MTTYTALVYRFTLIAVAMVLMQCGRSAPKRQWRLLESPHAADWRTAAMEGGGEASLQKGELSLAAGDPMSGFVFHRYSEPDFPTHRYRIEYETMRTDGADFFGSLTFPVRGTEHLSLILGGWGGCLVGLSCIDGEDASNNSTRGNLDFKNNRWYAVHIEVVDEEITVWIDKRLFIRTSLKGRTASLRPGDIESCRPFGFASYFSRCRVRSLVVSEM